MTRALKEPFSAASKQLQRLQNDGAEMPDSPLVTVDTKGLFEREQIVLGNPKFFLLERLIQKFAHTDPNTTSANIRPYRRCSIGEAFFIPMASLIGPTVIADLNPRMMFSIA